MALAQESSTQPLELPDLVIEEIEQINVKTGIKQPPTKTPGLMQQELDSLNSLDKKQAPLLPIENLPEIIVDRNWPKGFLLGSLGAYLTPQAQAGLGFTYKDFELFANGGAEMSNGHTDNAGYQKYFARLSSDYFTPEKYWIFGGSRTRTQGNIKIDDYNLYALDDAPSRTALEANAMVDVDGNYAGFQFETGAGYEFLKLSQSDSEISETSLNGYLTVKNLQNKHLLAGNATIDFRGFRDNAINFMQLYISDNYLDEKFSLFIRSGVQFASSYNDIDRGGFLLESNVEYRLNYNFTMKAEVSTGLNKITFSEFNNRNPYISFNSEFDYPFDVINFNFVAAYHPYETVGINLSAGYRQTERYPIFNSIDSAEFLLDFHKVSILQIAAEGFVQMTEKDLLNFNLQAFSGTMPDNDDNPIPYLPDFQASIDYNRQWTKEIGTKIGIVYVGQRPVNLLNDEKIDNFINLRAEVDWQLYKNIKLYANFDNLLNSDIFIWKGYLERNIFGSVGILWQF